MTAYVERTGQGEPERYELAGVMTLGRDESCTVTIMDPHVSRQHALVRELGRGAFYLMDSGSFNGTHLNGRRLSVPMQLRAGDVIRIGSEEFVFRQEAGRTSADDDDAKATIAMVQKDVRSIVVLVADIRNYTSTSERAPVETISRMMSGWFVAVQAVVGENGGVVDKFIGDCVLATWDASEGAVGRAIRAGLRIQRETRRLSASIDGLPDDMRVGVGIHEGYAAFVGGVESTVMGDTVNVAFRLEAASKMLNGDVVVSEAAYRHLDRSLWEGRRREVAVKGKSDPVQAAVLRFEELEAHFGTGAGPTDATDPA